MYPTSWHRVRKDWSLARAGYTQMRMSFLASPSAWRWAWFLETFVASRAIRARNRFWSGSRSGQPTLDDSETRKLLEKLFKECR